MSSDDGDDLTDTEDARGARPGPSLPGDARRYLLVLDGDASWRAALPRSGSLLIGRSSSADIAVKDASVSRQHARVSVEEGEVFISDLGSHNGVRVNGLRVAGSQVLQSGNVVALGDVTLVFHCGERSAPARPVLDAVALRRRLAEELERVRSYESPVAVLALDVGTPGVPVAELLREAGEVLRPMDVLGQVDACLMAALPELDSDEAEAVAEHLLELLAARLPQARVGVATAPRDGLNAEALMAAARAAALKAAPGGVCVSGPDLHWLALGERSMLVVDPQMVALFERLRRLAATPLHIHIHGETGAGKEDTAWAVHCWSPRAAGPFKTLNCATIPESLAEAELFGVERGAYSGADRSRAGILEEASGGTLFLDEVGELPLPIQAKLLRALEQQRITRLGDSRERQVDVRIVSATHRVLETEVKAGRFREDLYFRLCGAPLALPPLRDRPQELPLLASVFLARACAQHGRPAPHLSAAAMEMLSAYPWPGNVRELKSAMEYVAALCEGAIVEPSHLRGKLRSMPAPESQAAPAPEPARAPAMAPPPREPPRRAFRSMREEVRALEQRRIREALEATGGVQVHAAQLIGEPLRTFINKMNRYRITWCGEDAPP